jgi:hypothetical protein
VAPGRSSRTDDHAQAAPFIVIGAGVVGEPEAVKPNVTAPPDAIRALYDSLVAVTVVPLWEKTAFQRPWI